MSAKYLDIIYKEASKRLGPLKGREYLAEAVYSIVYDLEEAGKLSPEAIEMALKEESEFCASASEDVA